MEVTGQVHADGSTLRGIGFIAARTAEGRYTVTFDAPFADVPFILVRGANPNHTVGTGGISAGSFNVLTHDLAAQPADQSFSFLARDYAV